ncbi:DUF4262 domain-containing protein [Mesorhizobium quangtriensis]|uniref:DUF4262 domain-containing protein n=1 Tax=Mesorhizobium quangtriensis TaxID=3157709 RepID=UPI003CCCFFD4
MDEHGWHVTHVSGDDDSPAFTYSTGIFGLTGDPELIVLGLPMDVGHFVLNEYGNRRQRGETILIGDYYDGFLEGHLVTFLAVKDEDQIMTADPFRCSSLFTRTANPVPFPGSPAIARSGAGTSRYSARLLQKAEEISAER